MGKHMCILVIALVAIGSIASTVAQGQTILEIVEADPDKFSILGAALSAANLTDTFAENDTYTVFAPTNAAINSYLTEEDISSEQLLASDMLSTILMYHVLGNKVMSGDVPNGQVVMTLADLNIGFDTTDGGVLVAHSRSPKANVTTPDVEATNGVVHVIDRVLVPPTMTITEMVTETNSLSTLLAAVNAANLGDELAAEGPLTVFAPTNDGVTSTLGSLDMTAEELLGSEDLAKYLQFHVKSGITLSPALTETTTITTLGDMSLPFVTDGDSNDVGILTSSNLVTPDLIATNGVVHVVNKMMIPPMDDGDSDSSATSGAGLTWAVMTFVCLMVGAVGF